MYEMLTGRVPFDEAMDVADKVPKPDLQKPPRRTVRKEMLKSLNLFRTVNEH